VDHANRVLERSIDAHGNGRLKGDLDHSFYMGGLTNNLISVAAIVVRLFSIGKPDICSGLPSHARPEN